MKTTNLVYLLFVTATIFTASLLYIAVQIKNPLDMKYRETVALLCDKNDQLNNEAEALVAYPSLHEVKEKIVTLKAIRCQIQWAESSPVDMGNQYHLADKNQCEKRLALLVKEIHYLLQQIETNNNYASMLRKEGTLRR